MLTEKVVPTACEPEEGEKYKFAAWAVAGKIPKITNSNAPPINNFFIFLNVSTTKNF